MTLKDNEQVDLPTPTGPMRTYVFRPTAAGRYPGVLLYSEIFQVTGPIRRTAAMLAGHGFVVAVPEIYHEFLPAGTVLAYDQAGADRGGRGLRCRHVVGRPGLVADTFCTPTTGSLPMAWTGRCRTRPGRPAHKLNKRKVSPLDYSDFCSTFDFRL